MSERGVGREPSRARLQALLDELGLEPSAPAPCPYLPGRESRLVVVRPQQLGGPLYHAFMDLNFRRLGDLVYRPECPGCRECRQLRVAVAGFRESRAQRRCARRNADVSVERHAPADSDEAHAVYERYLAARHDGQMSGSREEFREFVTGAATFTEEVEFRVAGRLLGAGFFDATPRALSAVYFFFDPELAGRSPGVLNVLWLVGECRRRRAPWLYLGYSVAGCAAMSYKGRYRPNQVLGDDGAWR